MAENLTDKMVGICNALSTLGTAIARAFIAVGAKVFLFDDDMEKLAYLCHTLGVNARYLAVDMVNPGSLRCAMTTLIAQGQKFDIFIALTASHCSRTEARNWDMMFDLNVGAVCRCVSAILPHMMTARNGQIIIVGSIVCPNMCVWKPIYFACKHGLLGLAMGMRREALPYGVTVTSVQAGPTGVKVLDDLTEDEDLDATIHEAWNPPHEVARSVAYVAIRNLVSEIRELAILPKSTDL